MTPDDAARLEWISGWIDSLVAKGEWQPSDTVCELRDIARRAMERAEKAEAALKVARDEIHEVRGRCGVTYDWWQSIGKDKMASLEKERDELEKAVSAQAAIAQKEQQRAEKAAYGEMKLNEANDILLKERDAARAEAVQQKDRGDELFADLKALNRAHDQSLAQNKILERAVHHNGLMFREARSQADALRAALDDNGSYLEGARKNWDLCHKRHKKAEAQLARLREALEFLEARASRWATANNPDAAAYRQVFRQFGERMRAALAGSGQGTGNGIAVGEAGRSQPDAETHIPGLSTAPAKPAGGFRGCTEDDILGPCPNHDWARGSGAEADNEECLKCGRRRPYKPAPAKPAGGLCPIGCVCWYCLQDRCDSCNTMHKRRGR